MTRYGPWIQEDDFDAVSRWTHSSGAYTARRAPMLVANGIYSNSYKESYQMDFFYGWSPYPDGNMMELVNSARNAPMLNRDSEASNPVVRTTRLTRQHIAGTIGEEDWGDGGSVVMNRFPYYVPLGFASASELGWSPFYYSPAEDPPPGAVDYEVEGDGISDWLSATLLGSTQLRADNIDNSDWAGRALTSAPTTTIYTQTVAQFNAPDGAVETPVDNSMTALVNYLDDAAVTARVQPLGFDIDLTSTMGPDGCVLTTLTDVFISPQQPDAPTLILPNNYWEYGFYIDRLDIGWTLRPPRYRWIYDSVPIRRTFPRDDSLAGGAGRTWPPPKSAQQSNRTFGGYI